MRPRALIVNKVKPVRDKLMAISPQEFCDFDYFDPTTPRVVGYATRPSLVRDEGVALCQRASNVSVGLISGPRTNGYGCNFSLPMRQPFPAAILAQAKDQKWVVQPEFWELVERIRLPKKSENNSRCCNHRLEVGPASTA